MALSKALQFVHAASVSEELRTACSHYSKVDLQQKLDFSDVEFEDAINMQLTQCESYQDAEVFQQLKIWFLLL